MRCVRRRALKPLRIMRWLVPFLVWTAHQYSVWRLVDKQNIGRSYYRQARKGCNSIKAHSRKSCQSSIWSGYAEHQGTQGWTGSIVQGAERGLVGSRRIQWWCIPVFDSDGCPNGGRPNNQGSWTAPGATEEIEDCSVSPRGSANWLAKFTKSE